jgi:cell division protein FtsA
VGVRGITQLVAGPQYATGVGLVQYGASALLRAREHAASSSEALARVEVRKTAPPTRLDTRLERALKEQEDSAIERRGGQTGQGDSRGRFWSWLRAAF